MIQSPQQIFTISEQLQVLGSERMLQEETQELNRTLKLRLSSMSNGSNGGEFAQQVCKVVCCLYTSQELLSWISEDEPFEFKSDPTRFKLANKVRNVKQSAFIDQELKSLLNENITTVCDNQYLSMVYFINVTCAQEKS